MHARDLAGTAGNHRQLGVEALQIELADDAVMRLLHQEHARARFELLLDEPEFSFGESESFGVFSAIRIGVGKEDFGRRLLDQRSADRALKHIARTLRREAHDAVQFAPGLRAVLGEAFECRIRQQPPELVHPAHQPAAVEKLAHQMKQIQRDRRAGQRVIEEFRHVESDDRRPARRAASVSTGLSNTQA